VTERKRIMISIPKSLLAEIDGIVTVEKRNRSEFIRDAVASIIQERRKRGLREQMRVGYQEMAQLNLAISRELFNLEQEVFTSYEGNNIQWRR
jgi:CopG family transcriptional regulator/antitoxin EndoAI